ncbi:hypothetical protein [Paenibacillus sp. HJGM_3]|uniref:hypothetical protein n=1 Tax=Paenibacillus sp. HJGM_3 TaxID=3379816 RepID=UPI00385CA981
MNPNADLKLGRLGVLLDAAYCEKRWALGLNVFERSITEWLGRAGLTFELYETAAEAVQARPDLLIAAADSDRETAGRLWAYAEQGGTLIAYGGLNAFAAKLGCMRAGGTGPGYALLPDGRYTADRPLRFLGAEPWRARPEADAAGEAVGELRRAGPDGETAGPALQRFAIGRGRLDRWAVAVPATLVGLQQGTRPVLEDGVPAPDGSAAVNDGVLKADDVAEQDWTLDRRITEAGEPYFAHPYADLWKEVLVSHLLQTALERGFTLPFLGDWPEGVSHVALLSLDSDHTQDEEGTTTLELLEECSVPATWCMMAPWYSPALYQRIQAQGHELALHYNAVPVDGGTWSETAFREQAEAMKASADLPGIVSNKNHLTRVEGWGELFRWCEANGIASEQSRGNSKKGSVGFLYATAQPYFPIAWSDEQNRFYDVLQIGFHYGDFLQCDPSIIRPLLEQAAHVRGVAHFVFHQIHIHRKPAIRDFLRKYAETARQLGFVFWTGQQINDWERARRKVRITGMGADGVVAVDLPASVPSGAIVWIPCSEETTVGGPTEYRFGVRCRRQLL